MGIKNTAGINHSREKVLRSVEQVEEVLNRVKSELANEVKEDDVSVSHANPEWWMASSTELTKAIAEHDVAVAYGMGN
jgi:hypothetical protein